MADNTYNVYSWHNWFMYLSLNQLLDIRKRWSDALTRTQGHEHSILLWDLGQLDYVIMQRDPSHTRP